MSIMQMLLGAGGGGGGLSVGDVFSIDLTNGTQAIQTVTNGIDLAGEGGMVWSKARGTTTHFSIHDKTRGVNKFVWPDTDREELDVSATTAHHTISAFNNNGFTLGADGGYASINMNNTDNRYVHWTFREAPKFFDIVIWTGNSTSGVLNSRDIPHNLGCDPGMILVKNLTTFATDWMVWHHSVCTTNEEALRMNSAAVMIEAGSLYADAYWERSTSVTPDMNSSTFSVGNSVKTNGLNTQNYVAYLFAKDEDNIKCGKYTGSGAAGKSVTVGFKPQFLLIKRAIGGTGDWVFLDTTRGIDSTSGGLDKELWCPTAEDEDGYDNYVTLTDDGFDVEMSSPSWDQYNKLGDEYIYVAIKEE